MKLKKVNCGVWVKASEELPDKTGWYFVIKTTLKKSTYASVKDIWHFDMLKDKKAVPDYWCEIDFWLKPIEQVYVLNDIEIKIMLEKFKEQILKSENPFAPNVEEYLKSITT